MEIKLSYSRQENQITLLELLDDVFVNQSAGFLLSNLKNNLLGAAPEIRIYNKYFAKEAKELGEKQNINNFPRIISKEGDSLNGYGYEFGKLFDAFNHNYLHFLNESAGLNSEVAVTRSHSGYKINFTLADNRVEKLLEDSAITIMAYLHIGKDRSKDYIDKGPGFHLEIPKDYFGKNTFKIVNAAIDDGFNDRKGSKLEISILENENIAINQSPFGDMHNTSPKGHLENFTYNCARAIDYLNDVADNL